ncbi:MAG: hypothetical protein RR340_09035, partial [Cloacibacillus sp.]
MQWKGAFEVAGKEFALSVVIKAIDKATAPLQNLSKKVSTYTAPFKKFNNELRLRFDELGGSKVQNAFSNCGKGIDNLVSKTAKLVGAIAAVNGVVGGAVASIYKITRAASDYGDEAWKTSQKIGMNVEAWQEMRHAGEMSGVEGDALSKGMMKLSKNIVEAGTGNKTLIAWFKRAGVAFVDAKGKARSVEDVMADMAGVFGKQKDGAKKTAVAMALMGKSGADLIPMLNAGKDGMKEMRKEARDLGIVMDEKTAKSAEAFNDNVDRMVKVIKGLVFNLGSELIPVINDIVVDIKAWVEANRELIKSKIKEWVENLKKSLPKLKKMFFAVIEEIKTFIFKTSDLIEKLGGMETIFKVIAVVIGGVFLGALSSAIMSIIALGVVLTTTPAGWILLAIAGAAFLVYKAFIHWDKIGPMLSKLIRGLVSLPATLILIAWKFIQFFGNGFKLGWKSILHWFQVACDSLISFFKGVSLFDIGVAIFFSLWNGLKNIWALEIKGLSVLWEGVVSFFKAISLYDIGVKIFTSLWDGMKSIFKGITSWASSLSFSFRNAGGMPRPGTLPSIGPAAPMLPQHPRSQPMAGRAAAAMGAQQNNQTSKAAVQVEFSNLPRGTTITTKKDRTMDLATKVKMG